MKQTRDASKPTCIIVRALFGVSEHRIRFGNFFASRFGIRLFVAIGVVAQRELAKRILDRPLLGVAGNPEDFIVSRVAAWS